MTTVPQRSHKPRRRWAKRRTVLSLIMLVSLGYVVSNVGLESLDTREGLRRGLARRGRVAVVSARAWTNVPDGTEFVPVVPGTALANALRSELDDGVGAALRSARYDALLVDPGDLPAWASRGPVIALSRFVSAPGLVGRYLSRDAALYIPDTLSGIPRNHREALALVARRMLAGERPPRVQSFPAGLRAVEHVEVMVLLRSGPRPRLWRSARGSSIARAFLTAVRVAKTRWHERETAMGAPLSEALRRLHVEVALLQDDGELGTRTEAFIDRVVGQEHGVAYEHKGAWRYRLPEATREQGQGRPSRALSQLLLDHGLPGQLSRPDIRPYRLRVRTLSVSPPIADKPDPLAPPESPDEVLGHAD